MVLLMRKIKPGICRWIAVLLLVLFAFANTPRKFLHDLVANHTDTRNMHSSSAIPLLQTAGIHCQADNLVAESPFEILAEIPTIEYAQFFDAFTSFVIDGFSFAPNSNFLRGPPPPVV